MPFTSKDIEQIKSRGLSLELVERQIELLRKPASFIKIDRPATMGDGILSLSKENLKPYLDLHAEAAREGRLLKFVPASGAGTRMYSDFISLAQKSDDDPSGREQAISALKSAENLPFYHDLKALLFRSAKDLDELIRQGKYGEVLDLFLYEKGLNYANLPKAVMKFHGYKDRSRTAIEEHLIEAKSYVEDRNQIVRLHFTVSAEHRDEIKRYLETLIRNLGEELSTTFEIGLSVQKRSTETPALDLDNHPLRDNRGELVFCPGGHGALLENLNELGADIVFIKNIDNVCCDRYKYDTVLYKKALCGYLLSLQKELFFYLEALKQGKLDEGFVEKAIAFFNGQLFGRLPPEFSKKNAKEKACFLFSKLDRPLRVCGVVKNESEPGGAPFWTAGADGEVSLQMVEASEIDTDAKDQQVKFQSSTHFNPVDLVCGVRGFKGNAFNLLNFRNPEAVFISVKTKNGKKCKQIELPGLWNGGMARWNTVFVEVPISTFNPVKTVYDFLRKPHQCV